MINRFRNIFILLLACISAILFINWKGQKHSLSSIIKYVNTESNGLKKQIEVNKAVYTVTYKPAELVFARYLTEESTINKDSLLNEYSDCLYFSLDITVDSMDVFGRETEDFGENLKLIASGLNEFVTLFDTKSGKMFYLYDFVYPRLYGLTSKTSILICFKDPYLKNKSDLKVICKDFINRSPEELKFDFKGKDIKNIPKLKYE